MPSPAVKVSPGLLARRLPRRLLRRRSLTALAWAISTHCYKRNIRRQDERRGYTYADWIRTVEQPRLNQALAARPAARVQVGLVIAAHDLDQDALEQTLSSLAPQDIDWQLVFLLPSKAACRQAGWFRAVLAGSQNTRLLTLPDDFDPPLWSAFAGQMPGDWLLAVEPGTRMAPAWGSLLRQQIARTPGAAVVYWDEDQLDARGRRSSPLFKPDWSPEQMLSLDYICRAAFQTAHLLACPARAAPGGLLDAALSAAEVAHIPHVLAHRPFAAVRRQAEQQEQYARGLQAHLRRRGLQQVTVERRSGIIRAGWQSEQPLVSIIIPTRDHLEDIRRCLSGLLENTAYPRTEILLMDDHSRDPAVLAYYQQVLAANACVTLVQNPQVFNYSRVNNHGSRLARGGLLLFLNNDIEVVQPHWLSELVRWVLLPGVGMAGPKLIYPGGEVQHAGVVVGMTGHANHVCQGSYPPTEPLFHVDWYRNVSAVTGACMLVRRQVFEQLGGFDESLPLVFNDVELCQRVLGAGQRIAYVPSACLVHREGRTRGDAIPAADMRAAAQRLAERVALGDPYYSPNLSLAVAWPTFRRASDPDALAQLNAVVRFAG